MRIYQAVSEMVLFAILIVAGVNFSNNAGAPWWLGVLTGLGIYGVTLAARFFARLIRP